MAGANGLLILDWTELRLDSRFLRTEFEFSVCSGAGAHREDSNLVCISGDFMLAANGL
jgi:hypothetical protein